jgi:hypothetical protein
MNYEPEAKNEEPTKTKDKRDKTTDLDINLAVEVVEGLAVVKRVW